MLMLMLKRVLMLVLVLNASKLDSMLTILVLFYSSCHSLPITSNKPNGNREHARDV